MRGRGAHRDDLVPQHLLHGEEDAGNRVDLGERPPGSRRSADLARLDAHSRVDQRVHLLLHALVDLGHTVEGVRRCEKA